MHACIPTTRFLPQHVAHSISRRWVLEVRGQKLAVKKLTAITTAHWSTLWAPELTCWNHQNKTLEKRTIFKKLRKNWQIGGYNTKRRSMTTIFLPVFTSCCLFGIRAAIYKKHFWKASLNQTFHFGQKNLVHFLTGNLLCPQNIVE